MQPGPVRLGVTSIAFAILLSSVATSITDAAPPAKPPQVVDCGAGGTIAGALASGLKVITVRGTCTENVTITQDDVTIRTDGANFATIQALDPSRPTVLLDGARRLVVDGVFSNGITIAGGTNGLNAIRGATVDVTSCVIQSNTSNGVIASYGSTITVDQCLIQNNNGNGGTAANAATLVVTNSTVTANTAIGLLGIRSAHLRVGQDFAGTQTVKAVTITNNGTNGLVITDNSAGIVVGGSVTNNASTGIFVGRGSGAEIGQGSGALIAGVTVQGNHHGISMEGANATILDSTVTLNDLTGIIVTNAGSARIGIRNDSSAYSGNTITNNGSNGIHVAIGGSAFIGGNTIAGNGTDATAGLGRFGIGVFQAAATLAGNNTIQGNAASGVFARAGSVFIGDPNFGSLPTHNFIGFNGNSDATRGGIFAFQGGTILVRDATISDNGGAAIQAFENGVIELRASTVTTSTGANGGGPPTTSGIAANLGSIVRLRDTSSVISPGGDGAQVGTLSSIDIANEATPSTVRGNGATGVGVRCSGNSSLTGPLTNVSGTAGQTSGCFP